MSSRTSILFTVLVALLVLPHSLFSDQGVRRYAVVIGISGYPNYPSDKQIRYGDKDAKAFADFLQSDEAGGFKREDIRLLINADATRQNIMDAMKWLVKVASPGDLVYVFFAGHGEVDDVGIAYFMPYNADPQGPAGEGIKADDFLGGIGQVSADTVVFLDTCHAGAAFIPGGAVGAARGGPIPNLAAEWEKALKFKGTNVATIGLLAASSNQVSWEDESKQHGLFTFYLMEALKGAADTNPPDGVITAQEVFRYIQGKVADESHKRFPSEQTPIQTPTWVPQFPLSLYRPNLASKTASFNYTKSTEVDDPAQLRLYAEARAERRLQMIRTQPAALAQFLRAMPKGGDLEIKLSGAIPPETLVWWAAEGNYCVDVKTLTLTSPPCGPGNGTVPAEHALADPVLYRDMIDAYSVRNWKLSGQSAHDHFYDTFSKFGAATHGNIGRMLAETATRAASHHEIYQELMFTPTGKPFGDMLSSEAVKAIKLTDNATPETLAAMRKTLTENGLSAAVQDAIQQIDEAEKIRDVRLKCGTTYADSGCQVTQRYLFAVLRGLPKEIVFAQMLLGFELASSDRRIVGVGTAMPEDYLVPMHDSPLHMQFFQYLHKIYPKIPLSISGGELNPVSSDISLSSHILDAVELGSANRIVHGTALAYEINLETTEKQLISHDVLVVITLRSDEIVVDVTGADHPFLLYLQAGVPVTLATNDEGVLRTSLSQEYQRAVELYGLSYGELKGLARNSLSYSFLPGENLWEDKRQHYARNECREDLVHPSEPSAS